MGLKKQTDALKGDPEREGEMRCVAAPSGLGGVAGAPHRPALRRMRTNMHTLLTRKLLEVMEGYQAAQVRRPASASWPTPPLTLFPPTQSAYSDQFREKVRRQVQLVQPDATDKEVDEVSCAFRPSSSPHYHDPSSAPRRRSCRAETHAPCFGPARCRPTRSW